MLYIFFSLLDNVMLFTYIGRKSFSVSRILESFFTCQPWLHNTCLIFIPQSKSIEQQTKCMISCCTDEITALKIFLWSVDFIYLFIYFVFLQFLQILIGFNKKYLIHDSAPLTIS